MHATGNELCQGGICVSYTTNEVGSEYRIVHSTIQYSTIVHNVNQSYITLHLSMTNQGVPHWA